MSHSKEIKKPKKKPKGTTYHKHEKDCSDPVGVVQVAPGFWEVHEYGERSTTTLGTFNSREEADASRHRLTKKPKYKK